MKLMILASGSPRRKELLQMLEVPFQVLVSDTKEVITKNEPAEVTKELSYQKAMAVAGQVEKESLLVRIRLFPLMEKFLENRQIQKKREK